MPHLKHEQGLKGLLLYEMRKTFLITALAGFT